MEKISEHVSRIANETYAHSRTMPAQPWWDNLEPSFYKFPDDFHLDLKSQLMVNSTAAFDIGLRTAASTLVSGLALPMSFAPGNLKRDREQQDFYKNLADQHDTELFFKRPSRNVDVVRGRPGPMAYHPKDGRSYLLHFESPFEAVNPAMRESYAQHKKTHTAWAEYWKHDDGPRPTICVVHGFMADPYWINSRFLSLPWFYKQGYDVLLYTLPFHGRRQSKTSPFSGHGFFAHGFTHINETMAHAVHDFRIFLDWLETRGVKKVGVTGISLGGYTTSLLAAVEDRLEFAIPNVPVVSLVDIMLQWFPAGPLVRTGMRLAGTSVAEARHATAVHCPLTYTPRLPKDRLMIIGGAGDRLAPPKHARLLWDHWGRPRLHWFPGNHLIHLDQGKYLKEMAGFLDRIGFNR